MVLTDACDIRWLCQLYVSKTVRLRRNPVRRSRRFQRVEGDFQRSVANDMDVKREPGEVKAFHELLDDGRIVLHLPR